MEFELPLSSDQKERIRIYSERTRNIFLKANSQIESTYGKAVALSVMATVTNSLISIVFANLNEKAWPEMEEALKIAIREGKDAVDQE